MKTLQLAVSEFALPAPRSGSIEAYSGFGGLPNVGGAIHLEVQMQRLRERPGYIAEKWITHSFELPKARVTVSGRMDGFLFGSPTFIEEIKTAYNTDALIKTLEEHPHHPYKLQLRTYGYIQWLNSGYEPMLNLHVVSARSRKAQDLPIALDRKDYEEWLQRRLTELEEEQERFDHWIGRRKKLSKTFVFPFPEPRPGQRELMEKVKSSLGENSRILLQAPTGLGKTAGVLFPVLQESMARGQKTLYLTAKNTQHEVAEDAVRRLQEAGVKLRSVTIHAKTKMCMKDEPHCDPKTCEFARDHYTKVAAKGLLEKLAKKKRLTAKSFRRMAEEHEVCPFELQLAALPQADVVVCDYNYVFSPRNTVGRLTHNGWRVSQSRPNVVIDEAHNLPSRASEYFSARISSEEVRDLCAQTPLEVRVPAYAVLESLTELLTGLAGEDRRPTPRQVVLSFEKFMGVQSRSQELLSRYMESDLELQPRDPVVRLNQLISTFAQALENVGEEFFITLTPSALGGVLRITCCDASTALRESYDAFANVVGFSATLKPFDYYSQLLGMKPDELVSAEFESPFPRHHRKLLVIPQISTKMRDRQSNYGKIKDTIERLVALKSGNYFVFFPSFDFMTQVRQLVDLPGFRVLAQEREMRRDAVEGLLQALREKIPTVIFAVQGGVFAEGVDYPGDTLIGALVVGPALPVFDYERERLREYFDRKHGNGFDYAYTYPAMARVVQSAGRVIRSSQDRGLIVLMDRRFTESSYRQSMPKDWLESEDMISQTILNDVKQFWERNET